MLEKGILVDRASGPADLEFKGSDKGPEQPTVFGFANWFVSRLLAIMMNAGLAVCYRDLPQSYLF
jgi:hypothetical protein